MKALIEAVRLIAKLLRNRVATADEYLNRVYDLVDEIDREVSRSHRVRDVLQEAAASILTRANEHERAAAELVAISDALAVGPHSA